MFRGTERFEIVRRIGAGGMGTVFEAVDRERDARVALKTLGACTSEALLRFKNEFRALRDVYHRNLITLGELCEHDGHWFFTMEYVDGVDFLTHVESLPPELAPTRRLASGTGTGVPRGAAPHAVVCNVDKLRAAVRQLGEGLAALHAAGKIHRDIKPANVMVTASGVVRIVDFGLVIDGNRAAGITAAERLIGTPEYMSPEQARGEPAIDPRTDCYSAGVLIYRALTGMLPLTGTVREVIAVRQRQPRPLPPSAIAPGVPADLDALCAELLEPEVSRRPPAATWGERLHGGWRRLGSEPVVTRSVPFVGRTAELALLDEAAAQCADGASRTVFVRGEPGIGKTELLDRFAARLDDSVAVLRGRCYQREAVPYKGVDGVIDALSGVLAGLAGPIVRGLLPADIDLLAAMFPVLERVDAIAAAPRRSGLPTDPQRHRHLAFVALRELLTRLARCMPVVIVIDDLHWTDLDSVTLLSELLRPPAPARLLLVASMRDASDGEPRWSLPGDVEECRLARLAPDDAALLARELLAAEHVPAHDAAAAAIAGAAGGHPLFIDELVRHAVARLASAPTASLVLPEAIRLRIAACPSEQQDILAALVVAAPIESSVVAAALGAAAAHGFDRHLAELRAARLVRITARAAGRGSTDGAIEPYHDHIAQAVASQLDAASQRDWHCRIARALEARPAGDPARLARHWLAAGEPARAADYLLAAARAAVEALAFDRAVALYREAIALVPAERAEREQLRIRLAEAIAWTGRGAEAAELYERAAEAVASDDAVELYRRAAEQLLMQGYTEAGLRVLGCAMPLVDLRMPASVPAMLAELAVARARIWLSGGRTARPAAPPSPRELRCIDLCLTAAVGLGPTHPILGALFQTRQLLLATRAGEPSRMAMALLLECTYAAVFQLAGRGRAEALLHQAKQIAGRDGIANPHLAATACVAEALMQSPTGEWEAALGLLERAERLLREHCRGTTWEVGQNRIFLGLTLAITGRTQRLAELQAAALAEAADRGDVSTAIHLRIGPIVMVDLAADRPDRARAGLAEAVAQLPREAFFIAHLMALYAEAQIDLYEGRAEAAERRLRAMHRRVRTSFLLRAPFLRILYRELRARVAVAWAAVAPAGERRAAIAAARGAIRELGGERAAWAHPLAAIGEAGLLGREGRAAAALLYQRAADQLTACSMRVHAGMARYAAAQCTGDAAATQRAIAQLREGGVVEIDRLAAVYVPGLGRALHAARS